MFLTVANDISLKGIKRISDDYKYYLFLYNVKMHTFLDDVRCKSYFVGDPRLFYKVNMDKVLSKVFNWFTDEDLKGYLTSLRASAKTQMMDNPKPRELTKDEVENATDLLNDAVQKYIATKPESEQKQNFSGADIAKANPWAECKFGRTTYDTVYNMENKIDRARVISNLLND